MSMLMKNCQPALFATTGGRGTWRNAARCLARRLTEGFCVVARVQNLELLVLVHSHVYDLKLLEQHLGLGGEGALVVVVVEGVCTVPRLLRPTWRAGLMRPVSSASVLGVCLKGVAASRSQAAVRAVVVRVEISSTKLGRNFGSELVTDFDPKFRAQFQHGTVVLAKSAIEEFFVANPTIKGRLKSLDESDAAAARDILFHSWLKDRGAINLPSNNNKGQSVCIWCGDTGSNNSTERGTHVACSTV
ncbi:hypothetical protein T492DRAFT_848007 [Pavlovales sp. CCMP2436]|nr:hypothetical protein T492DRAFT_848007 [Pavlovales sp. CCMP2436]